MIDFAVPDGVEQLPPDRPGRLLRRQDHVRRRLGHGRLGQQDREGRPRLRRSPTTARSRPARAARTPTRSPTRSRQLDHPSFNERMRAQAALISEGQRGASAPVDDGPGRPEDRPASRGGTCVWALDGIAGGTPEATVPSSRPLKSPEADVRAQAARALGERAASPIAVEPLIAAPGRPRADGPAPGDHRPGADRRPGGDPGARPSGRRRPLPRLLRPRRPCGGSATGRRRPRSASTSNDPKVRAGRPARRWRAVYDPAAVGALIEYATDPERPADERAKALLILAQVHRKAKPWDGKWWGTRPAQGKPPAKDDRLGGDAGDRRDGPPGLADREPPGPPRGGRGREGDEGPRRPAGPPRAVRRRARHRRPQADRPGARAR